MHKIDEHITLYESAIGKGLPFFEKRYQKILCFYLSYKNGRFYFRTTEENAKLLINIESWKKDLVAEKLYEFFKKLIKIKK